MKKCLFTLLGVMALVCMVTFSYAQDPVPEESGTMMHHRGKMTCNKDMMGTGCCQAMAAMTPKFLVETKDGGIVLLAGSKLMKFDQNLNLVKEVQIKMDIEAEQEMMRQMQKNCPRRTMMMQEGAKADEKTQ
ncbi:MAG: hypothetical protein JXD19_06965 [Deltaproteobacteria bacterium]|nr:hypothetical protein [Deltaproteobacteria bacterium]